MNKELSTSIPLAAALFCLALACHQAKITQDTTTAMLCAAAAGAVAFALARVVMRKPSVAPSSANDELLASQARERLIADYSSDVHLCLNPDLSIAAVNPAVKRHWEHDSFLMLGKPVLDFVADQDRAAAQSHFTGKSLTFEIAVSKPSGALIETRWEAEYSNADSRIYCVVDDITERKQAQRLKQRLFAMIGHDLRAPLASARMALSTIPPHEKLAAIDGLLSRVIGLSNDMLDLQQAEDRKLILKRQLVEVSAVVAEVVSEFSATTGRAIEASDRELFVTGDEDRLKQVLVNFVSNAIKYAGEDARIVVSQDEIAEMIEIAVEDNGPGIPASQGAALFEPYARLDTTEVKDGRGLGLALCRYLAEAQGGSIGVRDSKLGGACFWIRLPKGTIEE